MGGREAGGVGGLLRLFCCSRVKNCKLAVKHRVKTCLVLVGDNVTHSVIFIPRRSIHKHQQLILECMTKYKVSIIKKYVFFFFYQWYYHRNIVCMRNVHYRKKA